ncbi:DUF4234 domain-containing protein [Schwartzia sp. (in: firmicutes)]
MERIERHDITLRVLFTFLTCGLYGLYWMAQVTNDVHTVSGKPRCASGGKAVLFSILTCSFYMYYWIYQLGGELVETRYRMGIALDSVANKTYKKVIVITTLIMIGLSAIQGVGNYINCVDSGFKSDAAMWVAMGAFLFNVVVAVAFSALLLWFVYKRSNPSPRILYVLMFLLRTNIFTLGFLQASLNDIADRQENGEIAVTERV